MSVLQVIALAVLAVTSTDEGHPSPGCRRSDGPQKLAVFFDGTWNSEGTNTNVERLFKEVKERRKNSPGIHAFYDEGVGSDARTLSGGALGYGFSRNVRQGYTFIAQCYEPGDRVYIFGFSRGAFSARALAAMIQQVGILNWRSYVDEDRTFDQPSLRNDVEELFKITKDKGKELNSERTGKKTWSLNDLWRWGDSSEDLAELKSEREKERPGVVALHPPQVEVIGLWDSVGALGLTHDDDEVKYLTRLEDLPAVHRAYQALSVDEARPSFRPVAWSQGQPSREGQVLEEVWFPGAHSDVGGGYARADIQPGTANLADLSLSWMVDQIRGDGLVREGFLHLGDEGYQQLATAPRHVETQPGSSEGKPRKVPPGAAVHRSVCDRMAASADRVEGSQASSPYRPDNIVKNGVLRSDLRIVGAVPHLGPCALPSSSTGAAPTENP